MRFFQAGDYEDYYCLLGYEVTQPGKLFPKFQSNFLPLHSDSKKLEVPDLSETLVIIYQTAQRHFLKKSFFNKFSCPCAIFHRNVARTRRVTCKSVAEGSLPLRVQQAVHFGRIYLLKWGKRCEHSCYTALNNHGNININIFSHDKEREGEK
jgi:hypothetical protein